MSRSSIRERTERALAVREDSAARYRRLCEHEERTGQWDANAAERWDDETHGFADEAADILREVLALLDGPQAANVPDVLIRDEALVCPHCEQADCIVEEDAAERWNPVRLGVNGDGIHVAQGDATFETTGWRCEACGKAVEMPEALVQNAEWS